MVGIAVVVAVYFIIGPLLPESFDALSVWRILNILMVVALGVALLFNYDRKRREGGRDGGRAGDSQIPGSQPAVLPHSGHHDPFPAQLVCPSGIRLRQPGRPRREREPPEVDNLGVCGRDAAHNPGRNGLPHVERFVLFQVQSLILGDPTCGRTRRLLALPCWATTSSGPCE